MSLRSEDSLPERPVVTIRPSSGGVGLDLQSVWDYRELLYFLTWRDVKVRYRQTVMGALWVIIQPLFTMIVFTLFFGRLVGVPSEGIPYPLFAFAGLLPWTFFSNAVNNSSNSLVGSSNLITKVYFPRMIIPGAAVAAGMVDFLVACFVLGGMMVWFGVVPTVRLILFPVLIILTAMLALGVGMWMSALNVKYRDVRFALPFAIQLLMFATPIIYPTSLIPKPWQKVLGLNPLVGLIEGYRSAAFGRPIHWGTLALSTVIILSLLLCSAIYFRRTENMFADIV